MDSPELISGTLFDIQGFSVHDGPGCRTLIFIKGCSLHCAWCANPEGISPSPEPLWNSQKCTFDLLCLDACPHGAISAPDGQLKFDRVKCHKCESYNCISACCSGALKVAGFRMNMEEVYSRINRDRQYWGSDGGITLTGGEPFTQPGFTRELLERCYKAYIHTAVETCGNVPWENIAPSLPYLDWVFYDLKNMLATNQEKILTNAQHIAGQFNGRLIFRMPVIPGINNSEENIVATARFIRDLGKTEINILPAHHMGREKYALLGQTYYTTDYHVPSAEDMKNIAELFLRNGIACYIGSNTPF